MSGATSQVDVAAVRRALRPGASPLVGRQRELAFLEEHAALVKGGEPLLLFVSGPPGVGKSRLLDEFTATPFAQAATVMRGGASRAEGMPPYLPLLQAIGEYIAAAPSERLRSELGTHAETLSTLFPEVTQRFSDVSTLRPIGPEQQRYRLYEGLAGFLSAIAASRPLLLLLDDLQWIDPASCDALVYVIGRLRSTPLMVLAASRDIQAGANDALSAALAELDRQRRFASLTLEPLDEQATASLAAAMLRSDLEPRLARLLNERSEGNPFFLEELVRGLVEAGAVQSGSGGWMLTPDAPSVLPSGAARAIEQRLARLTPEVLETLRVAAVVGRVFKPRLIANASGRELVEVESHLIDAQRAELLRPASDTRFAFAHDLIRETLLAQLGQSQRARLHRAVGEALEATTAHAAGSRLADLAFHFAAAGDPERGVSYSLAAAQHALVTSAPADAVRQLERALQLLPEDAPPARTAMLQMRSGEAALIAGLYVHALDAYQAAESLTAAG